jgi:hypothetical protein
MKGHNWMAKAASKADAYGDAAQSIHEHHVVPLL